MTDDEKCCENCLYWESCEYRIEYHAKRCFMWTDYVMAGVSNGYKGTEEKK